MSCRWDAYCLDCQESAGLENGWNHASDDVLALCKHAHFLAQIRPRLGGNFELMRWSSEVPLDWFAKHAQHRLVPRDEYGRCLDECGASFACAGCGHRERCHRKTGHDGDHGKERDA